MIFVWVLGGIGVGSAAILLIFWIADAATPDRPDWESLWRTSEQENLHLRMELYDAQLEGNYYKSFVDKGDRKMDEKVVVEPWFDRFFKLWDAPEFIAVLTGTVFGLKTDIIPGGWQRTKKFDNLTDQQKEELIYHWQKYVNAALHGYTVKQPQKAFKLPNGTYAMSFQSSKNSIINGHAWNTTYQLYTQSNPYWLSDDQLDNIQRHVTGTVITEGEEDE